MFKNLFFEIILKSFKFKIIIFFILINNKKEDNL